MSVYGMRKEGSEIFMKIRRSIINAQTREQLDVCGNYVDIFVEDVEALATPFRRKQIKLADAVQSLNSLIVKRAAEISAGYVYDENGVTVRPQ